MRDIIITKSFDGSYCSLTAEDAQGAITWSYSGAGPDIQIQGSATHLTFSISDFRLLIREFKDWIAACLGDDVTLGLEDSIDKVEREAHELTFRRAGANVTFEHSEGEGTIKVTFPSLPITVPLSAIVRGMYEVGSWIDKGFSLFDTTYTDVVKATLARG